MVQRERDASEDCNRSNHNNGYNRCTAATVEEASAREFGRKPGPFGIGIYRLFGFDCRVDLAQKIVDLARFGV